MLVPSKVGFLRCQVQKLSKNHRYAETFIKTCGFHMRILVQPYAHNCIYTVYLHSIYCIHSTCIK